MKALIIGGGVAGPVLAMALSRVGVDAEVFERDGPDSLQRTEGDEHSGNNSLSFAPVFVYEFGNGSVKPFVEAGIGVSVFSQTQIEGNKLGSAFNFEDRLGLGVRFAGGHEVSVRAIHYSNAGIKEPNDGIEAYSLNYRMPI